jgi:hypothetical protein
MRRILSTARKRPFPAKYLGFSITTPLFRGDDGRAERLVGTGDAVMMLAVLVAAMLAAMGAAVGAAAYLPTSAKPPVHSR